MPQKRSAAVLPSSQDGRARRRCLATPAKLLAQANATKDAGDLVKAEEIFRQAAEGFRRSAPSRTRKLGPHSRVAAYELALLLLQTNKSDEADEILVRLGFRYRLASEILSGKSFGGGRCRGEKGVVAAFDDVLPASLLAAVQKAFNSTSPFWKEHEYPTPCFFSYNEP